MTGGKRVTHQLAALQVFFNVGLCPEGLRQDRALGDASAICTDAAPLGQIKLGRQSELITLPATHTATKTE